MRQSSIHRQLLMLLCLCISASVHAGESTLVILSRDNAIAPTLVSAFETRYNARIEQLNYFSDEHRSQMLINSDAQGIDLILTSGNDLSLYIRRGWIMPLDVSLIPTLEHVSPIWRHAFEQANTHAVPSTWGTIGILYRRDLLTTPLTHWRQLYQPLPELKGRISMSTNGDELIDMGLKALGYSLNSNSREHLAKVEELLSAQKPFVKSYARFSPDKHADILSGAILASMANNGEAARLQKHNPSLVYVVPEEGSSIWVDYFAIVRKSREPRLAHRFINFINQPENAALQARYLNYATANTAAEQFLPEQFLQDPVIYPGASVHARSEFTRHLDADAVRYRNAISADLLH